MGTILPSHAAWVEGVSRSALEGQGYLFARPMPVDQLERWLRKEPLL
jgi:EAL domain-containing protein (putative c-di-GMP-specific phosphodiesterase class I)